MSHAHATNVGHAVLVGADVYADPGIGNLAATRTDVEMLAKVLRDPARAGYGGDNVTVLTGTHASRSRIVESLEWLADRATSEPDTTSLFYFSGHGIKGTGKESTHYLLPVDTDLERIDESALGAPELTLLLDRIDSSRVLVILDACHAAGATKETLAPPIGFKWSSMPPQAVGPSLDQGRGRATLSSCRADERSFLAAPDFTASVFTLELINALSGRAHSFTPGAVGVIDLFQYLDAVVPIRAQAQLDESTGLRARQHPTMDGAKLDNFPVALVPAQPVKRDVPAAGATESGHKDESLMAGSARLDEILALYEDQKVALEHDIALSSQDGQARVILRERLRIVEDELCQIRRRQGPASPF